LGETGINEKIMKMDLKETGCEDVDWINLTQDKDCCPAL
jgi:hypothetical protein